MILSNLALARRLERAEGVACRAFAQARVALRPDCGSTWQDFGGVIAVFDGVGSPTTQAFGLGMHEPVTPESLEAIERFFLERGADVDLEVCPLAGVDALSLLCKRGYRPIEISSVLVQSIESASLPPLPQNARVIRPGEEALWVEVGARAWSHEMPELGDFVRDMGEVFSRRENSPCFLAEADGVAGASASLSLCDGVALFAGAATVPELRRRGLQAALLAARLHHAAGAGCTLAMMVAEAGSQSQRNAQRQGFQIAYTRTKWRLGASAAARS